MLLDIVEVPVSHTGVNLGNAFVDVLKAFGIEDKVSLFEIKLKKRLLTCVTGAEYHSRQRIQQ